MNHVEQRIWILASHRMEAQSIATDAGMRSCDWWTLSNEFQLRSQHAPKVWISSCVKVEGYMLEALHACDAKVLTVRCRRH